MIYKSHAQFPANQRVLTIDGRRHVEERTIIVGLDEKEGLLYSLGSYAEVKSEELYSYVQEFGPATFKEISIGLDWGETSVRRYMDFLNSTGRVERTGTGKANDPYSWTALDAATEFAAAGDVADTVPAKQHPFFGDGGSSPPGDDKASDRSHESGKEGSDV
jgi:hypothetical protein